MRNIYARVSDVAEFVSYPGNRVHLILEPRFNGATINLVEVGREDVQDKINAYAPYTDIAYMLSRLKVGDTSVLSRRRPVYGDFSDLPCNPVDAINMVHDAERAFNRLPAETRSDYNNDYRVWLASLFTGQQSAGDNPPVGSGSDHVPGKVGDKDEP